MKFLWSKFGLKVAYFSLKSGEKWLISDLVFGYESGLILEMSGGFQNFRLGNTVCAHSANVIEV